MKKSRLGEGQIGVILKGVELGAEVGETCGNHGIGDPTFDRWKSQYAGMSVSHLAQMRELQDENAKLNRMQADLAVMHHALKAVARRKR